MVSIRSDSHLPLRLRSIFIGLILSTMLAAVAAPPVHASSWGGIKALYGGGRVAPDVHPALRAVQEQTTDFPGWAGPVTISKYSFGTVVTGLAADGEEWAFTLRGGVVLQGGDTSFWVRLHHRLQLTACAALGAGLAAKCSLLTAGVGTIGCIALGAFVTQLCMEGFMHIEQMGTSDEVPDTTTVTPPDSTGGGGN